MKCAYCTPLKVRECHIQLTPTLLLPINREAHCLRDGAEAGMEVCETQESNELQIYQQLQGKTAIRPTEGTATKKGNIISITGSRTDYLR